MIERIKQILDYSTLNNSSFAEKIGMNKSTLSHVLSGRNNPSLDLVLKIIDAFPEIDPEWLLNGKKSMLKNGEHEVTDNVENNTDKPLTLFDVSVDNSLTNSNKENLIKQNINDIPANMITQTQISDNNQINENLESKSSINKTQSENIVNVISTNNKDDKSIKRVILIYSDNTFEDFVK
ncbi:MAG: helix-turn-helix domain-containing protein [Bacteroidales bacterium]